MGRGLIARGAVAAVVCISLSGCVAAALPLLMVAQVGVVGFSGLKIYQMSTGGEVEIGFENETFPSDIQARVSGAQSIAFWPSPSQALTTAAERVQLQLGLIKVVPPATAASLIPGNAGAVALVTMTSGERAAAFQNLADNADVDLVVGLASAGGEADMAVLSLRRASTTYAYSIYLYDRSSGAEIWNATMTVKVGTGSQIPNSLEMEQVQGQALVDRLTDFVAGRLQQEQVPS